MIDQADERILDWARAVVPDVPVAIAPPPAADAAAGVRIHLLTIHPVAALRGTKRPPLELSLAYLVTANADDEAEAHQWLGALAFAALDVADWQVAPEPLDVAVWRAFGVPPRPSFVVRVPLRLERNDPAAPLVRKPLVLQITPAQQLGGVVVGPNEVPIPGATIEIPSLQLFARTDDTGAFRFPTVPSSTPVNLVVRAKRRIQTVHARPGEPLRIRIEDLEG
jgi:hypothetical protein